jgi:hypothetical protein
VINWNAIADMISSANVAVWDRDVMGPSVDKAWETWGEADTALGVRFVELNLDEPFPAKLDLGLGRDTLVKVVDWKTKRAGALDKVWEERETRSPQRKLYAAALASYYGPDIFPVHYEVRGIRLDEHKPATKAISSVITMAEAHEALRHLQDASAMRDLLRERKDIPWVKDASGCRMFGPQYPCEWEGICWDKTSPPPPTDEAAVSRVLSHSSAKEFLRCPELYRINRSVQRVDARDEDMSAAGTLFHQIMQVIYQDIRDTKHQ